MGKVSLNTIKNWFKTGLKPTQAQFWDTWDSFWHKDDQITAENIEGIASLLDGKADTELLQAHIENENAHGLNNIRNDIDNLNEAIEELQGQMEAITIILYGEDVDENGDLTVNPSLVPALPKPTVYVDSILGVWPVQFNKQTNVLSGLYGIDPGAIIEIIF